MDFCIYVKDNWQFLSKSLNRLIHMSESLNHSTDSFRVFHDQNQNSFSLQILP